MKKKISFIQITEVHGVMYGLHKSGSVWKYTNYNNDGYWTPITMEAKVETEEQSKDLE